jgi:NTE family protein
VPTALVLSAGGMYAAWEVGVWKALRCRFQPDIVVGASAGAWNGWAIAGGCSIEELTETWMDPATAAILQPRLRRKVEGRPATGGRRASLLRPDVLYERAREMFERFQPRIPYGLTMVEVPRLRPRVVRGGEVTWRHLAATCSIPVFFPPVRIDGRRYVDGGLIGALPLWAAEELGATRVIAVNVLTTLPFRALRRILPPRKPSPALEVVLLEPSVRLGPLQHAVRWSRENVARWIELGESDADRKSIYW